MSLTRNPRRTFTALALAAGLALAGCSSGGDSAPMDDDHAENMDESFMEELEDDSSEGTSPEDTMPDWKPTPLSEMPWKIEGEDGAVMTVRKAEKPLEGAEEIRKAAKIDDQSYLVVDVDNRNGTDHDGAPEATVVDPDGKEYEYETLESVIDDWRPSITSDYDYKFEDGRKVSEKESDRLGEIAQKVSDKAHDPTVGPHARRDVWLVGPKLPDEVQFVDIQGQPGQPIEE